jgi:hypothetical protein
MTMYLAVCPKCEKFFSISDLGMDYYCNHTGKLQLFKKDSKPQKTLREKVKCKVVEKEIK